MSVTNSSTAWDYIRSVVDTRKEVKEVDTTQPSYIFLKVLPNIVRALREAQKEKLLQVKLVPINNTDLKSITIPVMNKSINKIASIFGLFNINGSKPKERNQYIDEVKYRVEWVPNKTIFESMSITLLEHKYLNLIHEKMSTRMFTASKNEYVKQCFKKVDKEKKVYIKSKNRTHTKFLKDITRLYLINGCRLWIKNDDLVDELSLLRNFFTDLKISWEKFGSVRLSYSHELPNFFTGPILSLGNYFSNEKITIKNDVSCLQVLTETWWTLKPDKFQANLHITEDKGVWCEFKLLNIKLIEIETNREHEDISFEGEFRVEFDQKREQFYLSLDNNTHMQVASLDAHFLDFFFYIVQNEFPKALDFNTLCSNKLGFLFEIARRLLTSKMDKLLSQKRRHLTPRFQVYTKKKREGGTSDNNYFQDLKNNQNQIDQLNKLETAYREKIGKSLREEREPYLKILESPKIGDNLKGAVDAVFDIRRQLDRLGGYDAYRRKKVSTSLHMAKKPTLKRAGSRSFLYDYVSNSTMSGRSRSNSMLATKAQTKQSGESQGRRNEGQGKVEK